MESPARRLDERGSRALRPRPNPCLHPHFSRFRNALAIQTAGAPLFHRQCRSHHALALLNAEHFQRAWTSRLAERHEARKHPWKPRFEIAQRPLGGSKACAYALLFNAASPAFPLQKRDLRSGTAAINTAPFPNCHQPPQYPTSGSSVSRSLAATTCARRDQARYRTRVACHVIDNEVRVLSEPKPRRWHAL